MALIKNSNIGPLTKGASVLDLSDLTRESKHLLRDAEQRAHQVMHDAEERSKKLIDSATDRGFVEGKEQGLIEGREEGREAGRAEAIAQYKPQLEELQAAFIATTERWESDRSNMLLAARQAVLCLALAVAEKVTHRIVETDSTVVGDQLADALSLLSEPSSVTVSIAPQDRPLVESMLPELIEKISSCTHTAIRDDPDMTPGGCTISTGAGVIDATIERQVQRIVDTLLPRAAADKGADDEPSDGAATEEVPS